MSTKKVVLFYHIIFIAIALLGAGCGTLLQKTATSDSLPVLNGAATTNDVNALAWEKMALQVNAEYNQTSSQPLIAGGLGVLMALTSAFAGWYARHHTAQQQIAATKAVTDAAKPPV